MADGDSSAARRDLLELEPANRSRPEGEAPARGKTRREGDADDRSSRKEDGEGDAKGADKDKDDGGKKGGGKRWPLIIGGVVLFVAILAGGWYLVVQPQPRLHRRRLHRGSGGDDRPQGRRATSPNWW